MCFELSPGSITFGNCPRCGADSCYTFMALALNNTGVAEVGRITKCAECEDSNG